MTIHLNSTSVITTMMDDAWTCIASYADGGQIIVQGDPDAPWEQTHLKAANELIKAIERTDRLWVSGVVSPNKMVWVEVD